MIAEDITPGIRYMTRMMDRAFPTGTSLIVEIMSIKMDEYERNAYAAYSKMDRSVIIFIHS